MKAVTAYEYISLSVTTLLSKPKLYKITHSSSPATSYVCQVLFCMPIAFNAGYILKSYRYCSTSIDFIYLNEAEKMIYVA